MLDRGSFATSAAEAAYPSLWNGLSGLWCMAANPVGGLLVPDLSARRNSGTLTSDSSSTAYVTAGSSRAMQLNGTTGYVNFTTYSIANDDIQTSGVTYSAWAYLDALTQPSGQAGGGFCIIQNSTGNGDITHGGCSFLRGSGYCQFFAVIYDGAYKYSSGTKSWDSPYWARTGWHHVVSTISAKDSFLRLYIDGRQDAVSESVTLSGLLPIGFQALGRYSGNYLSIPFTDAAIWNRQLTIDEISLLYSLGPGGLVVPRRRRVVVVAAAPAVANPVLFHSHYMSQGMRP